MRLGFLPRQTRQIIMPYKWLIHDTTENRVVPAFGNPANANMQKSGTPQIQTRQQQRDNRSRNLYRSSKRKLVSAKTGNACFYCGNTDWLWTYEHIIPKSWGGSSHRTNLLRACTPCNGRRGNSPYLVRFLTDQTHKPLAEKLEAELLAKFPAKFADREHPNARRR